MELREFLFAPLAGRRFAFVLAAREKGIFSGADLLLQTARELQLTVEWAAAEGASLLPGSAVLRAAGTAEQVARAEETLPGLIGKPSGVATAAAAFKECGKGRIKIVCGAWKKVAPAVRPDLRRAIATGGAGMRITDEPFIYLDKNYVRMFGGVGAAVKRAAEYERGRLIVVQLRGEMKPLADEAREAVAAGAAIIMIDTGRIGDLHVAAGLRAGGGWPERVRIAYAGGVTLDRLPEVVAAGADIVDVGRAIIDAPLLDFALDVVSEEA